MAVNIDIFDFKCFNQLRNGEDFDQNLAEFTPNLVGNVGEKVKIQFSANFSYDASAEGAEIWNMLDGRIERSTGNFKEDGIIVGNVMSFFHNWSNRFDLNNLEFFADIDTISADGKVLTFTITTGSQTTIGEVTNVGFIIDTLNFVENQYTASLLRFGLIGNNEPFNFISKTSKGQQVYYAIELALFTEIDYISLGKLKDWVTGKSTIEFTASGEQFVARYDITHELIINPWFILEFKTNLLNDTVPELLTGDNSLKYAFDLEFRQTLTDIVSAKSGVTEDILGVVGWFGENFNGFNNNYEIVSIAYEDNDTSDPLDGVGINNNTKVTVVIGRLSGSITSDFSASVHISRLPISESEYQETETDMVDNFLFDSLVLAFPDTSNTGTGIIKSVTSSISAGLLTLIYVITYATSQKLRLTEDLEYMTWIQIENNTLATGNSDRVAILADLRNYTDANFVADFLNFTEYDFFTHELERGVDTPKSSITDTINEDGIALSTRFSSDASKNVVINTIRHTLIARNLTTGIFFELDSYDVDIGATIIDGNGVQQFTVQVGRGYDLTADDQFNLVELLTKNLVGSDQFYEGYFGQKIKWQDWLDNGLVDTVFFDNTKPNDNLNFRTSNYSEKNNYEIFLATVVNVSGNDDLGRNVTGDFIQLGNKIIVDDYDDSPDITGVIETFDPDTLQSLGGAVLYNGKDTIFKAIYTRMATETVDYAIHRIEPSLSLGTGIQELSSKFAFPSTNIIIPLSGQTQLKITDSGLTVVTECLISGTKVQEGIDYKLSARIGIGLVPPLSFVYSVTVGDGETISLPMFNGDDSLYDCIVNFGDGTGDKAVTAYADTDRQHTYVSAGTFDITVTDTFDYILFADSPTSIVELKKYGTSGVGENSFANCVNFTTISATDSPSIHFNTLAGCFAGCSVLNSIINIDAVGVVSMLNMFNGCSLLNSAINLTSTSSVTNMSGMFFNCSAFNKDISALDASSVTNMEDMMRGCIAFNSSISFSDTSSLLTINRMLRDCIVFNQSITFNTSLVTTMREMLRGALVFNQNITFNTAACTDMSFMFDGCTVFNGTVSDMNTSLVTDMGLMFNGCNAFNQSVSGFNTALVTSMPQMFMNCTVFNQSVPFNTILVADMFRMFTNCSAFDQSVAGFTITSLTGAADMFLNVTLSTSNYDAILIAWEGQAELTNVSFHGGNSLFTKSPSAAETARSVLIATSNWSIIDGGPTP